MIKKALVYNCYLYDYFCDGHLFDSSLFICLTIGYELKLYYALARPLHQFYNMGALQLLSSAYIPYGEQALVN